MTHTPKPNPCDCRVVSHDENAPCYQVSARGKHEIKFGACHASARAGLNPAAFKECVEALRLCLEWILLGNHEEAEGWIDARNAASQALTHATQEAGR